MKTTFEIHTSEGFKAFDTLDEAKAWLHTLEADEEAEWELKSGASCGDCYIHEVENGNTTVRFYDIDYDYDTQTFSFPVPNRPHWSQDEKVHDPIL